MLWEVVTTFWFDVAIIRGRIRFTWPTIVYWAAKYCTLIFITTMYVRTSLEEISLIGL